MLSALWCAYCSAETLRQTANVIVEFSRFLYLEVNADQCEVHSEDIERVRSGMKRAGVLVNSFE